MSFSVQLLGAERMQRAIEARLAASDHALTRGLIAAGLIVRNAAVLLLQKGPKTGRIYFRRSVAHRASAPGEAPATDTGNLVRSIGQDVVADGVIVFAAAEYARKLEFGEGRVAARPFLRRALTDKASDVRAAIAKALQGVF